MADPTPRETIAWLMWCIDQGYTNAEDRAILTNWLMDDDDALTLEDHALRPRLLEMADEVIAAVASEHPAVKALEAISDLCRSSLITNAEVRVRAQIVAREALGETLLDVLGITPEEPRR